MKKLFFLIILISNVSNAIQTPAFMLVPNNYKEVSGSMYEVANMPRVRSQDSSGVCHAFSGSVLVQKYYCDLKKIENCAALPPDKEISPIGFLQYSDTNKPGQKKGEYENHTNIQLKAGSPLYALLNARQNFSFYRESCFPFDQFVAKYGTSDDVMSATMAKLEDFYKKNKYKNKTEADAAEACEACLSEKIQPIANIFPPEKYLENIHMGLKKDTFGEFLYETIFSSGCKTIDLPTPDVLFFPAEHTSASKLDVENKIIAVIKSGFPVSINGICVEDKSKSDICAPHEFVISGIKKVCDSGKCRELFKVQNSWGKEWQAAYNDGWVDAESILQNISDVSGDKVNRQVITWLAPK